MGVLRAAEHILDKEALASIGKAPKVQIVFPDDRRTRVADTTKYPYRAIGWLEMTFPNGDTYTGTGTLIGAYHVLTAAHNLYGQELDGWVERVTFTPAKNGNSNPPWGSANAARVRIPEEYVHLSPPSPFGGVVDDVTKYIYDFGLVTLDRSFEIGEVALCAPTNEELKSADIIIAGYPGDKALGTMWEETGKLTSVESEHLLFYQINTYPGQSGSSLLTPVRDYYGAVGVHVAGSSYHGSNFAVRLNQDNINAINGWMHEG